VQLKFERKKPNKLHKIFQMPQVKPPHSKIARSIKDVKQSFAAE
jgi:hypothetical protein